MNRALHLNVVLVEPEIPQNTGSIGRTCLAVGATLHLVHPMAFKIDHSRLRRAGLDYWEHLNLVEHGSIEEFLKSVPEGAQKIFFSSRGGKTLYDYEIQEGAYLIFGKETAGLPDWVINRYPTDTARLPMFDARVRCLNLSNAASIGIYEAVRQNWSKAALG